MSYTSDLFARAARHIQQDDNDGVPILSIFCMIDNGNSEDEDPSDRRLKDRRTPRIALRRHCQSSLIYLFNSGNEQALLNCCGVDHKVFRDLLLDLFQPYQKEENKRRMQHVVFTAFNCPGSWHV
eukprot:jgi/Psemu1/3323/gm1.3323_g